MTWQIVQADARALPLADASVDLIVTSPPYWGLRSYRDGGEHYSGQIGSEPTPQEWVDELVGMIDGEWRRVLKTSGSMWLNLGDKMAGSGGAGTTSGLGATPSAERGSERVFAKGTAMARPKSLLGLPWRVALALIDRGWILRAEIIWSKPNGLPESVTDRVRRSHEQVFHFVLEPRYFSAVDEIREPQKYPEHPQVGKDARGQRWNDPGEGVGQKARPAVRVVDPLGRLPGSVWQIPTSPLIIPNKVRQHYGLCDHFAAYPPELVRRIILGWSPKGVCERCGEGRRPVVERSSQRSAEMDGLGKWGVANPAADPGAGRRTPGRASLAVSVVGEACACPTPDAETTPGVVLDPMCGTGTTIGVAHKLGRHAIGVDLSADYCRLAEWRVGVSNHFDRVDDKTAQEAQEVLW